MNIPDPEIDPKLEKMLKDLRQSAPRDPQTASRARNSFLAEAKETSSRVSNRPQNRLEEWKEKFIIFWNGSPKEKNPMFNFVTSVILTLGLVFGAGATTVVAAQSALPDDTLYPVKIWSEDVRLNWADTPQNKLDLALKFTSRRSAEIQTALEADAAIPEPVVTRLENQQRLALNLAAGLPSEQARPALEQIRDQARQQENSIAKLKPNTPVAEQVRARVQNMLQMQAQIAQTGLDNPTWMREQLRLQENNRFRLTPVVEPTLPLVTPDPTSGPRVTDIPKPGNGFDSGNSQNPWIEATHTPNPGNTSGNGAGSDTTGNSSVTPDPVPGKPSKQPGDDNGNGNGNKP